MGCNLPEHLRQYYLDAMGITCWQAQEGFSTTIEKIAVPEKVLPEKSSQTKQATAAVDDSLPWQALEKTVASCDICEALCQSRTQTVFGVGNRQADVFIISEAPDDNEDSQGEPFVAQSGNLLTAMLKAIKLEKQDVYITNIIKCRPPQDRDPSALEAENCSVFLRQQIALIQPKVIVALGRIASQNLLATNTTIGELRGQQYNFEGLPVIVTYHPDYLLRKPSEKRKAWQDLLQLQALMASWQ